MPQANLNRFFISVVLPSILAIALFILAIFVVILPSFERNIIEGKKEMISELSNTVCSLIEEYKQEAEMGIIQADSARALAIERVGRIRYGDEQKDYFWIIDRQPRMIMHPYRPELNGTDLSSYKDPEGKLLFVESVRIVSEQGEGFIDYMWQWKDDSTRIVPKLSYVKDIPAWDWIVGTGIYLEDVHEEIRSLKKRLLRVALLITLLICIILAFIIRQSFGIEKKRKKAEKDLRLSREKYKSLVEASTEGTLMLVEKRFVFSNLKFSTLSGYDPEEIRKLRFEHLFSQQWTTLEAAFSDPKMSVSREAKLQCKDGSARDVVISLSKIIHASQPGYIIIIKEVSPRILFEQEAGMLNAGLQTRLSWMNRSLENFAGKVHSCQASASVREVAMIMTRKQCSAIFLEQEGKFIGYVTHKDLISRILASDADPALSVLEVMSAPVLRVPQNTRLHEGLLLMEKRKVEHILLERPGDKPALVVSREALEGIQENMLAFMLWEVAHAEGTEELKLLYGRLPVMVNALVESGSRASNINSVISSMADAIHVRIIELALEEAGAPPCEFAFIVMGSQGRNEQSLLTDQDNAIIIEKKTDSLKKEEKNWFLKLGGKINEDLAHVGYSRCDGEIMAGNPKWNQDIMRWKNYFSSWISNSDPAAILNAAIFFDFKHIYGNESLTKDLREHVHRESDGLDILYYHMAQSILKMKLPANTSGDIDLKWLLLPLVSFLRLYAIREKLEVNNSLERGRLLLEYKIIDQGLYEEIRQSFDFLSMLRISRQARAIARNENPDNICKSGQISSLERHILKKVISEIKGLQTRLGTEFNR